MAVTHESIVVALVSEITEKNHWREVAERFAVENEQLKAEIEQLKKGLEDARSQA